MLTTLVKKCSGTAGEALENHAYQRMVQRYGEDATRKIIEAELRAADETWDSLQNYRRMKAKIQNDEISFLRAEEEAKSLSHQVLR